MGRDFRKGFSVKEIAANNMYSERHVRRVIQQERDKRNRRILELWQKGMNKGAIARKVGIPRTTVRDIVRRGEDSAIPNQWGVWGLPNRKRKDRRSYISIYRMSERKRATNPIAGGALATRASRLPWWAELSSKWRKIPDFPHTPSYRTVNFGCPGPLNTSIFGVRTGIGPITRFSGHFQPQGRISSVYCRWTLRLCRESIHGHPRPSARETVLERISFGDAPR